MISFIRQTNRGVVLTASFIAVIITSGCGSDVTSGKDPAVDSSSTAAFPSGSPGTGIDQGQLQKIQRCLKAAGVDTQMPSGAPTDLPANLPSGFPSGDPSNGGPAVQLNSPEVQAALRSCGIELPQGMPSAPPS